MAYDVRSFQGRVLVVAANASVVGGVSQISQTFYVFFDQSSLSLLGQFSIVGKNLANLPMLIYMASPKLTKVGAFFTTTDTSASAVVIKSANYTDKTVIDIVVPDRVHAVMASVAVGNKNYFFLGELFFIVRNSSGYNSSNPTANPLT